MPKITTERYSNFRPAQPGIEKKREFFLPIKRKEFIEKLNQIKFKTSAGDRTEPFKIFSIILWMTAARPNEVLRIQAKHIIKKGKMIVIQLHGSKRGNDGIISLPLKDTLVQQIWDFSKDKYGDIFLFHLLKSNTKMNGVNRVSTKINPDGSQTKVVKHFDKVYLHTSNRLYKWFMEWFGVPPYLFRHSRLTVAADALDLNELMLLKRSKTLASVVPYLHLTEKKSLKFAPELVK